MSAYLESGRATVNCRAPQAGLRVEGLGFWRFRVQGSGFRVVGGLGFRVYRAWGSGSRVSTFRVLVGVCRCFGFGLFRTQRLKKPRAFCGLVLVLGSGF